MRSPKPDRCYPHGCTLTYHYYAPVSAKFLYVLRFTASQDFFPYDDPKWMEKCGLIQQEVHAKYMAIREELLKSLLIKTDR